MVESRLERFKSGYETCNKLIRDYIKSVNREQVQDSRGTHMTRIAAMDDLDFWQGAGYLTMAIFNCAKHQKIMYRLLTSKDEHS